MALAFDFGTCNSVVARWNEALGALETPELPNLGILYPQPGDADARVIPSMIHFGQGDTPLVGGQVLAAGLVNHPGTFRWLKMDMLRTGGANRGRRVQGKVIYPRLAADGLVDRILMYVRGMVGDIDDELVLTVPVEAFDHYIDWLREAAMKRFPGGINMIDEATACMLGYTDEVLDNEPYCIVDFGGGTLDVSIVRTDLRSATHARCRILGRAGEEIGGIMIDNWLLEHIQQEQGLADEDIAAIGSSLLEAVEQAKISISNGSSEASFTRFNDVTGRMVHATFTADTLDEVLGKKREPGMQNLYQHIVRTLDRALDQARDRAGLRKEELKGIFLVGGSSLLPGIEQKIREFFPGIDVHAGRPFEAIARGACLFSGGVIDQTLTHDYCLRSWNRELRDFELVPVVPRGTPYPTGKPVCSKYIKAASDVQDVLGLVIYERTLMSRPLISYVNGADGLRPVKEGERLESRSRPLNPEDSEFIHAVPPCRSGDRRFIAGFGVDKHRRLTLWLRDTEPGSDSSVRLRDGSRIPLPVEDLPVVKL
ncbi:Hsp70 family protein [Prosthecochloris vibrioformis]|uniref:Hsp70 family protein n=1 Tax=Prosthecochloris vibrioformis TaxID=1098 RepID=A0A5C4RSX6_PROVB|nr:Hsp70 family protein [Prosthecochloris vibrioformis]TNJ34158.1 Hsp70 family protein [Prosthecochloris vibrioformis]